MSLISHNLMAFYSIWVGFSLNIIILIGEHSYTDFNVKNKFLILAPSLNVVCDVILSITSIKCGISQTMSMLSFISFEIICMFL